MRRSMMLVAIATSTSGAACGSDPQPICDAGELTSALAAASPGDIVEMGSCEISGSFQVKAGVTLRGQGRDKSALVGAGAAPVVSIAAGTPTSVVESLTVRSSSAAAIVARGASEGHARIDAVDVEVTHGVGIGAEKLTSLELADVALTGPVDAPPAASAETSSYGVALVDITTASLSNVRVTHFGNFGVFALATKLTWVGGGAVANAGTGLFVRGGGSASLTDLDLSSTIPNGLTDEGVIVPPYGGVFVGNPAEPLVVDSTALRVDANAGTGLLHAGASGRHVGLEASGNGADDSVAGGPAIWVQGVSSFELSDATLADNAFGGLFAFDVAAGVALADSTIRGTKAVARPLGEASAMVTLGDGVELVRSTAGIYLTHVELTDNARAGLTIDLGAVDVGFLDHLWSDVVVSAMGSGYGVICQGAPPPGSKQIWGPDFPAEDSTWDDGITRVGAAIANDAKFNAGQATAVPQDIAGAVGPCMVPSPGALATTGLAALGIP